MGDHALVNLAGVNALEIWKGVLSGGADGQNCLPMTTRAVRIACRSYGWQTLRHLPYVSAKIIDNEISDWEQ